MRAKKKQLSCIQKPTLWFGGGNRYPHPWQNEVVRGLFVFATLGRVNLLLIRELSIKEITQYLIQKHSPALALGDWKLLVAGGKPLDYLALTLSCYQEKKKKQHDMCREERGEKKKKKEQRICLKIECVMFVFNVVASHIEY